MLVKKGEQVFETEKVLLLDDLRIDVRRSQSLDLSDDKVANALNGLVGSAGILRALGRIRTLSMSFSKIGSRSLAALLGLVSDFFLKEAVFRSSSASILAHVSSMCPSEIFEMTSGDRLSSSTRGPRAFSTCFRFSSLLFKAVDRVCRDSMSADTVARSLRKLARLISTELRTSSHASIDRWRSSSLDRSFSPGEQS